MKKIISIIAVLAIMFTFSVTAFAATATMTVAPVEVDVATGTQDVNVDVVFTMDEATTLYGVALNYSLPTGVTVKSVDWSNLKAVDSTKSWDEVQDTSKGWYSCLEAQAEGTGNATASLTIPCVLTVDTSSATVYDVSFSAGTGICDVETYEPINATCPTFTITVKAAGPTYSDNDYVNAKITPVTDNITVGGQEYKNVAVFDGSFDLATVKAGLEEGESVKEVGVMFNDAKVASSTISVAGDGSVTYKVLFYGITADQANALNIKTYYTLTEKN